MDIAVTRRFTAADQADFARASGDANPLHMDPAWAAGVYPGEVVVHGMHAILWACDAYFARNPGAGLKALRVTFDKPILLDEDVTATNETTPGETRILLAVRGVTVMKARLILGGEAAHLLPTLGAAPTPAHTDIADLQGHAGVVTLPHDAAALTAAFPALTAAIGPAPITGLAALSTLVGMACPGRHSLFGGFDVARSETGGPLSYAVTKADRRFNRVTMAVEGYGLSGTVTAFHTAEPERTPLDLTGVRQDEFKNAHPLILGATSGLGLVTTALLSAGGAAPVATWRSSPRALDGRTAVLALPYDVGAPDPLIEELATRGWPGQQVYYFPTPRIFRRRLEPYQPEMFREFTAVYVDGFHGLMRALVNAFPKRPFRVLYPSSILAADAGSDSVEYGMAKAAGERLCARLMKAYPQLSIIIERLPGLATRQTVSVVPQAVAAADTAMLPIIRRVQATDEA